MSIEAIGISKRFGAHHALRDVSVHIETGGLVALLGPSGSGKTTLLRVLAGLEAPDTGRVRFAGRDVSAAGVADRGVGFVFQHYALFREMSVFENVAFGLRVKPRKQRPAETAIRARVRQLLELVQLDGLAERRPSQLSGGQRQRVALARALAVEPKVLLLDEPFGALDAKVRRQLRAWLRSLHEELRVTTVLVTHDQEEALEVADRVVLMNEGRVEQVGSPRALYEAPASAFVAAFLGDVNVLEGTTDDEGSLTFGRLRLRLDAPPATPVRVAIRTSDVELTPASDGDASDGHATLTRVAELGDQLQLEATLDDGSSLRARRPRHGHPELTVGARVHVAARVTRVDTAA